MSDTRITVLTCLVAAAIATGCTGTRNGPAAPAAQGQPQAATRPAPPAAKSAAWTVNRYKRDVAESIYRANAADLFEGAPPPMLKSVVVLGIIIDSGGQPKRVEVRRSNGFTELERVAMQSVRRAAPLPRPGLLIARNGTVEFTETWLFREDGRFQIRSLAEPQSTLED